MPYSSCERAKPVKLSQRLANCWQNSAKASGSSCSPRPTPPAPCLPRPSQPAAHARATVSPYAKTCHWFRSTAACSPAHTGSQLPASWKASRTSSCSRSAAHTGARHARSSGLGPSQRPKQAPFSRRGLALRGVEVEAPVHEGLRDRALPQGAAHPTKRHSRQAVTARKR